MPESNTGERPPIRTRARVPGFQPRFTLMLLYLAVFFFAFSLLLVLPDLLKLLSTMPPGPEQQAAAREAARRAMAGRALPIFLLSLAAAGVGGYYRILPGMRPH